MYRKTKSFLIGCVCVKLMAEVDEPTRTRLHHFNGFHRQGLKVSDFPISLPQRNPAETLEIYLTDISCMKGIHTWGRRSTPCVTRGESKSERSGSDLSLNLFLPHADRYTLKGSKYMICKRSGWTGEFPTCAGEDSSIMGD